MIGSAGQVALLVISLVGVVAVTTWLLRRRRRDVWQELAKSRGLRYLEPHDGPRVTGRLQGRTVEIHVEDDSSDRDMGSVEVVQMSVDLRSVPQEMTAEGVPGLIGRLATLSEGRIEFPQEEFDRNVLVKCDDPESAREYWNDTRQQQFLELVRTAPCDQVAIRGGCLVAEFREIVSDRHRLEHLLDMLVDAAPRLDQPGGDEEQMNSAG